MTSDSRVRRGLTLQARPLATFLLIATTCNPPPSENQAPPAPSPAAPASAEGDSPGLRAAYIAAAQAEAGAEYHFNRQAAADRVLAQNPAQQLAASIAADAGAGSVRLVPSGGAVERRVELALSGLGCGGSVAKVAAAPAQPSKNRVEYARPEVTEWYVNGPLGLEQGFTIPHRPSCAAGDGTAVELEVSVGDVTTATLHGSGDSSGSYIDLRDVAGKSWLRYSDVYSIDARGTALPTRLAVVDGRIRLSVDDSGAQYPITVDPLVWTVEQQLRGSDTTTSDFFGRSVAVSGNTALIGAFQATLTGKPNAGAAYVFVHSGSTWTQQQKIVASDAAQDAAFGYAVALSGNTALIGAPGAAQGTLTEAGAAYVFTRTGTTWTLEQRLAASDAAAADQFGDSVSLDGDSAVVGADYADVAGKDGSGAAYVFTRSGTTWSEQKKLSGSDSSDGDHFAQSVSISGNSVVAGAPYADVAGKASAGAAYVFVRAGTVWSEQKKATASDAGSGDGFGTSVALVNDTLLVGAPGADVGGKVDAGATYYFARGGAIWAQKQKLTAALPAASDAFGQAVAANGTNGIVGADGTSGGGAAYLFTLSGMSWTLQQSFVSPFVGADGNFGRGVALDGDSGVIGAPYSTVAGAADSGVAIALALGMTKTNGLLCASATECTSGFCVDGVCCNSACGGGAVDCQACSVAAGAASDGSCALAKAGAVCRTSVGDCDSAESCDGKVGTCPADTFKASTTMCRNASDACDVAEYCTGAAGACPTDNLKPSGTVCRASIGACDVAEACNGASAACPSDTFLPNTSVCRASAGPCDVADFCTGSGPSCPTDQVQPSAVPCRAAAGPCDATELCTGTSADCPADAMKKMGTICRTAAGLCDADEVCTGTSIACPADVLKPNTTECRPAADLCDSAEFCTGSSTDCPTDAFKPKAAECRPVAGSCDVAEYCSGGSPSCPTDTFRPTGTTCRVAASSCDADETCSGAGAACPEDKPRTDGAACTGGTCQTGACRQEADLRLALTASTTLVREQTPVSVQLAITNLGPAAATGTKVTIDLPAGTTSTANSSDGWSCQSAESSLVCTNARLEIGAGVMLKADIVPPKEQSSFAVTARVSANEVDPDPASNTATVQFQNESPTHDGGCAMSGRSHRNPTTGFGVAAMLIVLAASRRRWRRRP